MTRISELTTKLLDATLDDSEAQELDAILATDPAAEAEYLTLLAVEVGLRGDRTDLDIAEETVARIQEEQAERTANAVLAEIQSRPAPAWLAQPATPAEPTPRRKSLSRVLFAAIVASAAAIFLSVWLAVPREPNPVANNNNSETPEPPKATPTAFAKLARKTGQVEVVNRAGLPVPTEEGSDLPPGFTLRTVGDDSLAVVDFLFDNTRFEIESDSVVRFEAQATSDTKPQLFLATGQLTAAVSDRPTTQRPLIVGTPVAEVFARGGTFVVSSAAPDSTRVDIRKGKVELVRNLTPAAVSVDVGRSAFVNAGVETVFMEQPLIVDRIPKRTHAFTGTRDAIFSPDGNEVWLASAKSFTRWSPTASQDVFFFPRRGNDGIALFSKNKQFLATFRGERDDRVLVRTLPDGGEHTALNLRPAESRHWTMSPHAEWFAIADTKPNKRVRVFDGVTTEERFTCELEESVGCVTASADGRFLAVGLNDLGRGVNNKVVFFDSATGSRRFSLPTQKKALTAMAFSTEGNLLAVGFNGMVQVWDVSKRELLRSITGFERAISCLTFSTDGKRIAAGTHDGYVWLWDATTGQQTQLIEAGGRGVRAIAFSPNSKQLVTVVNNAPVAVWDVADRLLPRGE